uniref:Internal scaffolding protein n=1 Tax=Haemonchus contortus TaxID=6289 RepID=A0A7I4XXH0_HAECO|nr:unnamed protein product [Haemonchus contortus]
MPSKTVNTSTLPEAILELLGNEGAIIWNNQTSLATYYYGFPDVQQRENQFIAACITGLELENRDFRTCVNATHMNGVKGGHNITEQDFHKFYKACNNDLLPSFKEEDEDDYDKGKNASDEGLEELKEAAGLVN